MTPRDLDLMRANRDLHKRLKAASRRGDELFAQLTEATRQIRVLREAAPAAAAALDMEVRAATLASTAQVMVNHCAKLSRVLSNAAAHGQTLIDSASAIPAPTATTRDRCAPSTQEARQ